MEAIPLASAVSIATAQSKLPIPHANSSLNASHMDPPPPLYRYSESIGRESTTSITTPMSASSVGRIMTPTHQLAENAVGVRQAAKSIGRALVKLERPEHIMIVAKVFEANIISFTRQVACYLVDQPRLCHTSSEGLKIYVDAKIKNHPAFNYTRLIATNPHYAGRILFWDPQFCATNADLIDFVVTLGGDGTVLFTSWLFQQTQVPPVIPFHLGSLGFLTNFNVVHIRDVLERVIGCRGNGVRVNMRMRLQCTVWRQGGRLRSEDPVRFTPNARERKEKDQTTKQGADGGNTINRGRGDFNLRRSMMIGSSPGLIETTDKQSHFLQGGPIVPPSVRTNQKDAIVPNFAISDTSEGEFDDSDDMLFFHTRNTSEGLHATPIYRKTSVPGIVIAEDETPLFASSINSPVVADIDTVLNAITSSLPCKADFSYDDEEPAAGSSESHTEIGKDTGMRAGIDSRARKPVPAESFHILNDLVVDRGPSAYMSQLELYVDDRHLTTVQADGLVVSTPTGSTAYSLSAGGSLVHPECPAILVTPICPHTLSFRPFLLPDGADLKIQVPIDSRSTAWASFDGRHRTELKQGDFITVTMSRHPLPTLCQEDQSSDWFESLRRCLHWNERARQRAFGAGSAVVVGGKGLQAGTGSAEKANENSVGGSDKAKNARKPRQSARVVMPQKRQQVKQAPQFANAGLEGWEDVDDDESADSASDNASKVSASSTGKTLLNGNPASVTQGPTNEAKRSKSTTKKQNAYMLYMLDHRERVREELGEDGDDEGAVMMMLAEGWRALSDEERAVYASEAAAASAQKLLEAGVDKGGRAAGLLSTSTSMDRIIATLSDEDRSQLEDVEEER